MTSITSFLVGVTLVFSGGTSPPGVYVHQVNEDALAKTAFGIGEPIAGSYYFYWYDNDSGAHFFNADGTDAMTRHPANSVGYSYKKALWHERELEDVLEAGLDFILPVYWSYPGDRKGWSIVGLPPLVEAARAIERRGLHSPRIGCFYDTSTLRHNGRGFHADLRTKEGKEWLHETARDFFSLIPHDLWATVEGRPILWFYTASFAKAQDPTAFDYLRESFHRDFGVEPYIVKEVSWKGRADATYAWGAALGPQIFDIAAVGPGYDHTAVPGRLPLVREREDGAFYRRSWEVLLRLPIKLRPWIAIVETWNEWHEATDIAPSRESGRKYVELTRKYTDLWQARTVRRPKKWSTDRREVSVTLDGLNRDNGLTQNEEPDGKTHAIYRNGRPARTTVETRHGGRYVYFEVDDGFFWADDTSLEIEVSFLDVGSTPIGIDYDSIDTTALLGGAFKAAPVIQRTNTGMWRMARLQIDDAAFLGRANRNDFRLVDRAGNLIVSRVVVRKL